MVLFRGVRVGSETVSVSRSAAGWQISATGRLLAPFDLITTKFEMTYGADWQAQKLSIEGLARGQLFMLSTSFGVTTASSDMMQGGQRGSVTHQVSPRTVVLPNNFYGAYEALAARAVASPPGTRFPAYVVPDAEVGATLERVTPRRIALPSGTIELRQLDFTFHNPSGPLPIEIWADSRGRLARVVVPTAGLVVIRDDLATVMAREERIKNPGDEDVFVPASGFSLGATITRASNVTGRAPAVILIGSSGPQDRDEVLYGVPIFGQLAGALADAGHVVVRYDRRGVGRSGGRTETAGISEYADDVVQIVAALRKRKDVDADRIAVVGYHDGGAVALTAAQREKRIKGVALAASPARSGRDVTIEQQQRLLATLNVPDSEKQAKIALQMRMIEASIKGSGWENVPQELRRQAQSAWFRSWLMFDPAVTIAKINQPVLILQGSLDTETLPAEADRLEQIASGRKKQPATPTRKVVIAGVNHLFIPAKTGQMDEYTSLDAKQIAPEMATALLAWLKEVLASKTR